MNQLKLKTPVGSCCSHQAVANAVSCIGQVSVVLQGLFAGGGIFAYGNNSRINLQGVTFSNNTAGAGAGIATWQGSSVSCNTGCRFLYNTAQVINSCRRIDMNWSQDKQYGLHPTSFVVSAASLLTQSSSGQFHKSGHTARWHMPHESCNCTGTTATCVLPCRLVVR